MPLRVLCVAPVPACLNICLNSSSGIFLSTNVSLRVLRYCETVSLSIVSKSTTLPVALKILTQGLSPANGSNCVDCFSPIFF